MQCPPKAGNCQQRCRVTLMLNQTKEVGVRLMNPLIFVLEATASVVAVTGDWLNGGSSAPFQAAASANLANAGRDLEPVFFMIEARWFSTVRWLMPRSAAIFLLGWPARTIPMIWRCRAVSPAMRFAASSRWANSLLKTFCC